MRNVGKNGEPVTGQLLDIDLSCLSPPPRAGLGNCTGPFGLNRRESSFCLPWLEGSVVLRRTCGNCRLRGFDRQHP